MIAPLWNQMVLEKRIKLVVKNQLIFFYKFLK